MVDCCAAALTRRSSQREDPGSFQPDRGQGHSHESRADVILRIHEDLADVRQVWCEFEQRADCTVFQAYFWASTWQRYIGSRKGARPVIVTGHDQAGQLLFLLPLAVERHGLARALTWLGSDNCDYNAPLLAPDFSRAVTARSFGSLWIEVLQRLQASPHLRHDLIHFVRMPAQIGRQPNPFVQPGVTLHASRAYLTHLAPAWDSFYASRRSSSTRQRERTKRNRLNSAGDVQFITPATVQETSRTFDELVVQKTRSFKRMGASNIFLRPGWTDFYRALATEHGPGSPVHVSRLDVGATPAAVNLGLKFRGCYYHVLASHTDGALARFSPGATHLHELMRHAIESGHDRYDFTIGDESYKLEWSDSTSDLFDQVKATTLIGACIVMPVRSAAGLKRYIKQTPAIWKAFNRCRAWLANIGAVTANSKK